MQLKTQKMTFVHFLMLFVMNSKYTGTTKTTKTTTAKIRTMALFLVLFNARKKILIREQFFIIVKGLFYHKKSCTF